MFSKIMQDIIMRVLNRLMGNSIVKCLGQKSVRLITFQVKVMLCPADLLISQVGKPEVKFNFLVQSTGPMRRCQSENPERLRKGQLPTV